MYIVSQFLLIIEMLFFCIISADLIHQKYSAVQRGNMPVFHPCLYNDENTMLDILWQASWRLFFLHISWFAPCAEHGTPGSTIPLVI